MPFFLVIVIVIVNYPTLVPTTLIGLGNAGREDQIIHSGKIAVNMLVSFDLKRTNSRR